MFLFSIDGHSSKLEGSAKCACLMARGFHTLRRVSDPHHQGDQPACLSMLSRAATQDDGTICCTDSHKRSLHCATPSLQHWSKREAA